MGDISSKQRILKLIEIFKNEIDENNTKSMKNLIDRLKEEYATDTNEYEIEKRQ